MSRELVKVVVTTYNRPEWARLTLESVLAQTHPELHVVIVDDASTDATADLAREYEAAYPGRVTAVVKRANKGLGDSIGVGLVAGPGADYVAFLNDDDLWLPDKLERQLELFRAEPDVQLVYTGAAVIDQHGVRTGRTYEDIYGRHVEGDFNEMFFSSRVCGTTIMIRGALAERLAPSFPNITTWDYYTLLVAAGLGRIAGLDDVLLLYRDSPDGMHHDKSAQDRDNTAARQLAFDLHPELTSRVGGPRRARRMLALRSLEVSAVHLARGQWAGYAYDVRQIIRQRQIRPVLWLLVHTAKSVLRGSDRRAAGES